MTSQIAYLRRRYGLTLAAARDVAALACGECPDD